MSHGPLVSIVMPNFNGEKYIAEAIGSVFAQTHTNWELIIVDDCSDDASWSIISDFAASDERVKAFRNERNMKVRKTRMRGLNEARGRYYAVLDSDDVFVADKIEKQVQLLQNHPECGVVGCDTVIINERGEPIGIRNYPHSATEISASCIRKNPFANSATVVRMELIRKYMYDGSLSSSGDYDLWLRILGETQGRNLPECLLHYRKHRDQITSNSRRILRDTITIQLRYLFRARYFSVYGVVWILLEMMLLAMPQSVVVNLFRRLEYRDARYPTNSGGNPPSPAG